MTSLPSAEPLGAHGLPLPLSPANGVEIRHLSKCFRVSTEPVGRTASFLAHRFISHGRRRELWALKDVSFDLPRGDMLGILGANGSGKSTLLRIITGISEPGSGEVRRLPRVAALLDLAAGFHPSLTGYENLFLNGSIIGIPREELRERLGDIIAFSGVDPRFLESPVRTYSSGMMARLGFALAVSVDPDIVLIDEVLAVGDLDFMAKSARKLLDFRDEGKAMALVSHASNTVQELSSRAIWLDKGALRMSGPATEVVSAYNSYMVEQVRRRGRSAGLAEGEARISVSRRDVQFTPLQLQDESGRTANTFTTGSTLRVRTVLTSQEPGALPPIDLHVILQYQTGNTVEEFVSSEHGMVLEPVDQQGLEVVLTFAPLNLLGGKFTLQIFAVERETPEEIRGEADAVEFTVETVLSNFDVYPALIPVDFEIN